MEEWNIVMEFIFIVLVWVIGISILWQLISVAFRIVYAICALVGSLIIMAGAPVVMLICALGWLYQQIKLVFLHAKRREVIREMGLEAVANELTNIARKSSSCSVILVDRGDGVHVPSKGEW
jgi:hypothetical protein